MSQFQQQKLGIVLGKERLAIENWLKAWLVAFVFLQVLDLATTIYIMETHLEFWEFNIFFRFIEERTATAYTLAIIFKLLIATAISVAAVKLYRWFSSSKRRSDTRFIGVISLATALGTFLFWAMYAAFSNLSVVLGGG